MESGRIIIKQSSGAVYILYCPNNRGISCRYIPPGSLSLVQPVETSIMREEVIDFHAAIDNDDTIYVLALTAKGELKHFSYTGGKWDGRTISAIDLKVNSVGWLYLHVFQKRVYVLYAVKNPAYIDLWTVYFKSFNGNKWINNNLGTFSSARESVPYCISTDTEGNIHIAYKVISSGSNHIFYRKYNVQFSTWSSPEKVLSSSYAIDDYFLLSDIYNELHLLWTTSGNNCRLQYKKLHGKVNSGRQTKKNPSALTGENSYIKPVILIHERFIWAIWSNHGQLSACRIGPDGSFGNRVFPIGVPERNMHSLVRYISNSAPEHRKIYGSMVYCSLEDEPCILVPPGGKYKVFSENITYVENKSIQPNDDSFIENDVSAILWKDPSEDDLIVYSPPNADCQNSENSQDNINKEIKYDNTPDNEKAKSQQDMPLTEYQNAIKNIQEQNYLIIKYLNQLLEKTQPEIHPWSFPKKGFFKKLFGKL